MESQKNLFDHFSAHKKKDFSLYNQSSKKPIRTPFEKKIAGESKGAKNAKSEDSKVGNEDLDRLELRSPVKTRGKKILLNKISWENDELTRATFGSKFEESEMSVMEDSIFDTRSRIRDPEDSINCSSLFSQPTYSLSAQTAKIVQNIKARKQKPINSDFQSQELPKDSDIGIDINNTLKSPKKRSGEGKNLKDEEIDSEKKNIKIQSKTKKLLEKIKQKNISKKKYALDPKSQKSYPDIPDLDLSEKLTIQLQSLPKISLTSCKEKYADLYSKDYKLPLPFKYKKILNLFEKVDNIVSFYHKSGKVPFFKKIQNSVRSITSM